MELAPPWLHGRWGEAWARALGLAKDLVAEGAMQAVKARLLRNSPPDALPYAGTDRQIERGPGEADASYRARLLGAFETWRLAGTNKGIVTALAVIGYPKVSIYENKDWAPGDPRWWRFWIVVEPPHSFTTWKLGDGTKLGSKLLGLDEGGKAALDLFRGVVRKWKAAHTTCESILIVLSGTLIGTGWKLGDGTKLGSKSISVDL
ncbi:MAG: phage tail protein [Polyangiales bacterium]